VFIEFSDVRVKDVRLFGVDGKLVSTRWSAVNNNRVKISLPVSLVRGMYTIQVTTDKGEKKALIIVQ
jgi:hypothetical protein